jgi:hypothetical protein
MSRALPAVACAGLMLLAGCAAKAPKPPAEPPPWTATGPCAASLAELPSTVLAPSKRALWQGDFRAAAACLEYSGTARPVILLALDEGSAQQELDLFLHIGSDYLLGAAVSLLDASRQPLRSHRFDDFTARGTHFSLRLFPQPGSAATYVLIEVDRAAHGSDLDRISGQRLQSVWMAAGYMGSIADGIETQQRIAIRDTGELSLHRVVEEAGGGNTGRP